MDNTVKPIAKPTNEVLANFLVVYAKRIPGFKNLDLSPVSIRFWLHDSENRKIALKHHQNFQQIVDEMHEACMAGDLQCDHIRRNGKKCPNHNKPGSYFCGLHQDEDFSACLQPDNCRAGMQPVRFCVCQKK